MLPRSKRFLPTSLTLCLFGAALTGQHAAADSPTRRGTDVLHFSTRTAMVNESAFPEAAGLVSAIRYQQGGSTKQALDIVVKGLDKNATYQILARTGADSDLKPVGELVTDAYGRGAVRYRGSSSSQTLGTGKVALPEWLNPVTEVEELVVADALNQALLRADLEKPTRFGYLVKRHIGTDTVPAILWIKANNEVARTWILARVAPETEYRLLLNGEPVQTLTSDSRGYLRIYQSWEVPAEVLALESLSVKDAADTTVFSTTLP